MECFAEPFIHFVKPRGFEEQLKSTAVYSRDYMNTSLHIKLEYSNAD